MAERTFEMELDRCFAESPVMLDAEAFALRVTERLDRGWTFRQLLIGGLGIGGGLIGASQILGSGLLARLEVILAQSDALMKSGLVEPPVVRGLTNLLSVGSTLDSQVLWMSAALAALAVGLFVTRAIREI